MACWDILGKKTGLPVCILMGGRFGDGYPLYRAISQASPAEMAASVEKYKAEGVDEIGTLIHSTWDPDVLWHVADDCLCKGTLNSSLRWGAR